MVKPLPMPIARRTPPLGEEPDYARSLYNDPPSHDFCVWLITAELMRRHHGAPGPLHVRLVTTGGQLGMYDFGAYSIASGKAAWPCNLPRAYYETMLAGVMRPAMAMIGAVEEPAIDTGTLLRNQSMFKRYVEYDHHIAPLIDAARDGHVIPRWTVPEWAQVEVAQYLGKARPVVITLRESAVQPERNSQIEEWLRFADSLAGEGCPEILFIRDTAKADEPLSPYITWPRAARNAFVRAALYQRAALNLLVGTGPNIWCIFSNAPYLFFKQLVPALPQWAHGTPAGWRDQDHMEVGEQIPWATPVQRMTWADDTCENIRAAFDAIRGELSGTA